VCKTENMKEVYTDLERKVKVSDERFEKIKIFMGKWRLAWEEDDRMCFHCWTDNGIYRLVIYHQTGNIIMYRDNEGVPILEFNP